MVDVVVGIIRAAKITAQHAVARVAHFLDAAHHAAHRDAHQHQGVRGQHQAAFDNLRDHFGGAGSQQFFHVGIVDGTHDHRQGRLQLVDMVQDLDRGRRTVGCNRHRRGAMDAGRHQRFAPPGVAKYHRLARRRGLGHAIGVQVERHVGQAFLLQHACQILAATAVTANNHMPAGLDTLGGDTRHLQRLPEPFRRRNTHHDTVGVLYQERRNQHRQQHGCQDYLDPLRVDQPLVGNQIHQDKTEFAGLRQPQAGADGHPGRGAESPGQAGNQGQFEQNRPSQQQAYQQGVMNQYTRVQQHAGGDKKQTQQHIAERLDVFFHLMPIGGFGNQHTGDKSPQRHRQAQTLGQRRGTQGHQQQIQHKQFLGAPPRHHIEPFTHDALTEEQQQGQGHDNFECGKTELGDQVHRGFFQRRNDDQQRHHRQVLEQQHADNIAAVFGFKLQPFGQHFADNGCRRHGHRAAQRKTRLPPDRR